MPKYSSKNVTITFNEGLVMTGLVDDDFVTCERNTEKRSFSVGADGTVVVNESNDDTGKITVSLQQTSPTNKELRRLYKSGKSFDINVADNNPNTADAGGSEAYVMNTPGKNNGTEVGENEWEILVADYTEE
ncbi:phage structural protein [Sporohalobacter salinus]|uniref:phage structural protein n=1 Tax=Sporohalobacter salinus TaxID=1494606 RepID=UPI00196121E5|nr:phage protein [Sporohalobacter salinus]MBM7623649.1 hypothetical protein [Sporohalobacter salinus]